MVRDEGKYIVKYIKSHCDHTNDYKEQYLTRDQKESIALKIEAGVILNEKRDEVKTDSKVDRAQLLSRKDLCNIFST